MPRTFSPEQKAAMSESIKARWAIRKSHVPLTSKPEAPLSPTEKTRLESSERLRNIIETNRLRPGEPNPVPPDPPANYGLLREVGKGGAISQGEREVGVDPLKLAAKAPDVVGRREEQPRPVLPGPTIESEAEPSEDGTVMRLPNWETVEIEEAEQWLRLLREEQEKAALIVNQRRGGPTLNRCANATCQREVLDGKEAFSRSIKDPTTGIWHRMVLCSVRCWMEWQKTGKQQMANPPGANLTSREG